MSTFYLGFAARLWSIGLGGLAEHGLLVDLHRDQLWFSESGGSVRLHLRHPIAWRAAGSERLLVDMVLRDHLTPLAAAVRRLGPISQRLLLGNAASALLGAARALSRHRGGELAAEPGWILARGLFDDERLSGTISFNGSSTDYRRTSCCLFYRTPDAGLCGDCTLTHKPETDSRLEKGST